MASYSFLAPRPTNAILSDVDHIREIQWILAQWNPSLADDAPEDSKRLVPLDSAKTQYRFERLIGSSWNSVGKLMHDVDTLDGYHASTSAVQNTIPVYNADAKLVGDLTGNANTATALKNIRKLQIGGIASGGYANFDGSADATIEIMQLTVNNANDTAINGILTVKHGGTGGADAATARANLGVPAINHASADKSFGVATTSVYGHTIGSDTINDTFTADKGYFFSPKGANDLRADLDAKKFDKSGGTITGTLRVASSNIDINVTPTSDQYGNWSQLVDKNGKSLGGSRAVQYADGRRETQFALADSGGNLIYPITFTMTADGKRILYLTNTDVRVSGNSVLTSAGGTVNGTFFTSVENALVRNNTTSRLVIMGGENWGGANIIMNGKDRASDPGIIYLQTNDGKNNPGMKLFPDGRATWNGHSILTSAGGEIAGSLKIKDGEITIKKSSYNRGTIPSSDVYQRILFADNGLAGLGLIDSTIIGGNGRGRVRILAYDYTGADAAVFQVIKDPATGEKFAMMNEARVLTSAGGTLSGNISFSQSGDAIIKCTNASASRMYLLSGNAWDSGATLHLYNKADANLGGVVRIYAHDGTQNAKLELMPNSNLTVNNHNIMAVVAGANDNNGNWYRKYSDGWIEQGGTITTTNNFGGRAITFSLPFANTYYAFSVVGTDNNQWMARTTITYRNKSATGITITTHTYDSDAGRFRGCSWFACGY